MFLSVRVFYRDCLQKVSTQLEDADCFFQRSKIHATTKHQPHAARLHLTRADVFPQAVLCDGDLQVRVVLPGVSVRRMLPAAGPR